MPTSDLPHMIRPVYRYPFNSRYSGTGNLYDAATWERGNTTGVINARQWPGEKLLSLYAFYHADFSKTGNR